MATIQNGSYREWHGTQNSSAPFGHDLSVTVAAGVDRCLVLVLTSLQQATSDYTVSYGGVPMTGLYAQVSGSNARHMVYYLLNPAVGTANLTANLSGWYGINYTMHALVLDGVSSAGQFKTPVSVSNPFGTSPVSAVISAAATDLVLSAYGVSGAGVITAGAGETLLGPVVNEGNANISSAIASKTGPATSAGFSFTGNPQPSLLSLVIQPAGGGGGTTVTGVTVSPASPAVSGGATQQFTASVTGANSPAQTVTWAASAGTINGSGLFTAPAGSGVAQTINVTATSTVDGTKSGAATVTVPAAYSQYPAPGQVQAGVVYGNAGQFTGTLAAGSGGGGIGIMIGGVGVTQNGELVIGVS